MGSSAGNSPRAPVDFPAPFWWLQRRIHQLYIQPGVDEGRMIQFVKVDSDDGVLIEFSAQNAVESCVNFVGTISFWFTFYKQLILRHKSKL